MGKKIVFYDEKDDLKNLNIYFKEIKKNKVLTKDEEIELAKRIKNGDEEAVKALVNANLRFVVTIAKDYQNQGLSINDLINEGNYGLLKAAKKFDHTMGFRFISYAVWWVRQSIINSLNENARTVRLPTNVINKLSTLNKELLLGGVIHNNDENTENTLTETCVNLAVSIYNQNESLNKIISENGVESIDLVSSEEETEKYEVTDSIKASIKKVLDVLDERERDIIVSYYGLNYNTDSMTLEAIGEKYSLTKERIRQIKQNSLRKLRYNSNELYNLIND
jgi:RNA polymerase primary sigma factor